MHGVNLYKMCWRFVCNFEATCASSVIRANQNVPEKKIEKEN